MKILLAGANGQLGIEVSRQNTLEGYNHSLIPADVHNLDIASEKQVKQFVRDTKPDVIINCAAYTNVDGCESDERSAFLVNAIGARNLSAAAFERGASVVQVSTDYVFDGTIRSPRKEMDPVNPISIYGKSKEMGERMVRETNPRHFIVRTAWLYGQGNNFVKTMLKIAGEKNQVNVVDDQFGSPTSTADLARCILSLIDTGSYGTYHATCEGWCSWYDFASKIFELMGMNIKVGRISSDQLQRAASRPKFSVLENYMLNLQGMNRFRNWEESLAEYLKSS